MLRKTRKFFLLFIILYNWSYSQSGHNINIDLLLIRTTSDFETQYFPLPAFSELLKNELFRLNIGAKNIFIYQRGLTREDTTMSLISLYRTYGDMLHTNNEILRAGIKTSGKLTCINDSSEQQKSSMNDSINLVVRNRHYVQLDLIPKKRVVIDVGLQWVNLTMALKLIRRLVG